MRLTSEFFVSALIRRVFGLGGFAAVLRKGAPEAGAIFIRQRERSGAETLYGPAPQSAVEGGGGRLFELRARAADKDAIDAMLAREIRFDGDCWIVEIEVETVDGLFDITLPE